MNAKYSDTSDSKGPRNRIRLTSAEQKLERDKAQRELNALGRRLFLAYLAIVTSGVVGLAIGLSL